MVNARDLLGQLMQAGMSGSANDRIGHAMGPQGLGRGGNPLGELLGGLLGGPGAGTGTLGGAGGGLGGLGELLGGGGMTDVANRADQMFPGAGRTLQDPKQLQIGGLAALAGALLGGRRGGMGGAVGGGLLALLGSLAYSTWKSRESGGAQATIPPEQLSREAPLGLREPQNAEEEAQLEQTAMLAIRAMVNAAKADGAIDGGEMSKIMGKLKEVGSDNEARDFVMSELQKPLDLDGLVADVDSAERAIQVYGASLLAIEVDTPAERDYLKQLATRTGLDDSTVRHIHETLGVPQLT
jgi:uncharacterized membrane protein YebE (DUF533 family)